jgi:hypothetical protein
VWRAVKVMCFQPHTKPIRLFNILNFPSIVKDELAVLQQRAPAQKTAETRIKYDTLLPAGRFLRFIRATLFSIRHCPGFVFLGWQKKFHLNLFAPLNCNRFLFLIFLLS